MNSWQVSDTQWDSVNAGPGWEATRRGSPCLTSLNPTPEFTKRHQNPFSSTPLAPFPQRSPPVSTEYLFSKLDHLPVAQTTPLRDGSESSDTVE